MTKANVRMCTLHMRGHTASSMETAMRICIWVLSMHHMPSVDRIRAQWGVSRATAYRWRAALSDAMGKPS